MKMLELVNGASYEVKTPSSRYGGSKAEEHLLIDKKMPTPLHEQRGKIRRVAMAKKTMGYQTKTIPNPHGWGGPGVRTVNDYDKPMVEMWVPVWVPINKIMRSWDEYIEEKEIEEEIKAARAEKYERERQERREREEAERKEQESKLVTMKERLDKVYPGNGVTFSMRYGYLEIRGDFKNLGWWEKLLDNVDK